MHLIPDINPKEYNFISSRLREFFKSEGLIESYHQNKLSILSACEDVFNVTTFEYINMVYPLIQTNQMKLEEIILKEGPSSSGYFTTTTSYRQEKNPVEGRHNLIFPMFEWECAHDMDELIKFEKRMLEAIGFGPKENYVEIDYEDACKRYNTDEITHEHEMQLYKDFGTVVFLKYFPERTDPFWNMARCDKGAKKIDVIICGQETIGSAERSCDKIKMLEKFENIVDKKYAQKMYDLFGKDRVDKEMEDFLNHDFFVRSGAGMGVSRMLRACKILNIIQ